MSCVVVHWVFLVVCSCLLFVVGWLFCRVLVVVCCLLSVVLCLLFVVY